MQVIDLEGERLHLLPERAIWWEAQKTLIVSDLHWGKSAHFRKHGIAIPADAQAKDELKLAGLLRHYSAERMIIAGDMFHSQTNNQVEIFTHFRAAHKSIHIDLVIGNHDILKTDQYDRWNLAQHKECMIAGPFCVAHDMIEGSDHFVLHGHVHPALRIKSKGSNQPVIKLCCFAQAKDRMILPAFGQFTGSHVLNEKDYRHLYLIADNKVIKWC